MATDSVLLAAFTETAGERAALKKEELAALNVDPEKCYDIVIGSMANIRGLQSHIAAVVPTFDVTLIGKIEKYAQALKHAHHVFEISNKPVGELADMLAQATSRRDRYSAIARMLVDIGIVPAARLNEIKGVVGYRNVANDLDKLALLLDESWSAIQGIVPVKDRAELTEARELARALGDAAAVRDLAPAVSGPAVDDRLRAYTLLARAYDEVRAVIMYVRRKEDDADLIAPSLFGGRNRSKKQEGNNSTTTAPAGPSDATAPEKSSAPQGLGDPNASPFITS